MQVFQCEKGSTSIISHSVDWPNGRNPWAHETLMVGEQGIGQAE